MHIKIAQKYRPFSHEPGASCLLPHSFFQTQAFPALLRLTDLMTGEAFEMKLDVQGPVREFTLQQDLERGEVRVFGKALNGYYCVVIKRSEKGVAITPERGSPLPPKILPCSSPFAHPSTERLSLGSHKAQDWDLVKRRCDLTEVLPVLLRLNQFVPEVPPISSVGTLRLLEGSDKLEKTFLTAFHSILVPRLQDGDYQGIVPEEKIPSDLSPLFIVKKSAQVIRSLFVQERQNQIALLPILPPEFHAGRLTGYVGRGFSLDLEWSKKLLKKAIISASESFEFTFNLQRSIHRFRMRRSTTERGTILQRESPMTIKAGETLYFDRFEK